MMRHLLLLLKIWPWKSIVVLHHLKSMSFFLRKHYSDTREHLLKLFKIRLTLKEKPKDEKSLQITYLRRLMKLRWIVHLMTDLGMSFFASLKRNKLPNYSGFRQVHQITQVV